MDPMNVQMDGTLRGLMPCDILGKPWIGDLDGCCGVGMNFKRALQRFRKFTTIAIQYAYNAGTNSFDIQPYLGSASVIENGENDSYTKNNYPAGSLPGTNLARWQTNLSQGGRPCPTTPESTFVMVAGEAIAEPTKFINPQAGVAELTGAAFLQQYRIQEYIQHETLRAIGLTYRIDQDGCDADMDPLRFWLSQYGKPGLDASSHNGVMIKGNALCFNAWIPIIQSQTDGQPNVTKLLMNLFQGVHINAGVIAAPPAPLTGMTLVQEVTLVFSGFCVPRDISLLMCRRGGTRDLAARAFLASNALNPLTGQIVPVNGNGGAGVGPIVPAYVPTPK